MKTAAYNKIKNDKTDTKPPIVLTAFGTTTKAFDTYTVMEKTIIKKFSGHKIIWAYSSRMVKNDLFKKGIADLKHPGEVLEELAAQGYKWAVIQSMHLICGHEFYRLIEEVRQINIRTSIGLPLLTSYKDYQEVISCLADTIHPADQQYAHVSSVQSADQFVVKYDDQSDGNYAVVFIGHGTDHPAWSSYPALSYMLHEKFGSNVHMGVVEGYPQRDEIIDKIIKSEVKKVLLIPFMLVAGRHLVDDIAGDDDSWKTAFEKQGITVSVRPSGLGMIPGIQEIFCRHIIDACDMISCQNIND